MTVISYNYVNVIQALNGLYKDIKNKNSNFNSSMVLLATIVSSKPLNVLLADDDEEDRELFIEALAEVAPQVKVTYVENGELLMEILKTEENLPNIIFLDLNMPHKNGTECLHEIRSQENLKNIPVIIYSTSSSRIDIEKTFKNGATLYITKPSSFKELTKITKKVFSINWNESFPKPKIEKFVFK
ncbi:MAG: response regulator [Bacteroidota bacterium]|nr:response regulator [Bacteroidota bacterium]